MFVSTMPLRIKIDEDIKLIDLIKNIGSETMSMFRHQKYPISETIDFIHKNNEFTEKIYNILLSYQNARSEINNSQNYSTEWLFSKNIQNDLEIHIMDMDDNGVLTINYDYLTGLFDISEISYLNKRLISMIENIIEDINVTVDNIRIIDGEEENKIIKDFNNTKFEYDKTKTVIDLFEEQVKNNPDNIAVVFEDKKLTYKELNDKSNILAYNLIKNKDVKTDDVIAILMNRSLDMIITILGILKAGGVYLPIDIEFPKDRIDYIINNSNSKCIIKDLDDIDYTLENYNFEKKMSSNVYMLYTSGSTGNPKGVIVTQQNLVNFVYGINNYINISSSDNVCSITTTSFDIFGLELWVPLITGAKVILANEKEQNDGIKLNTMCMKNNVDFIQTTPTKLKLLTYDENNLDFIKNMKTILLGGEPFSISLYNQLKKITNAKIFNVYGPTETTIWSTIKEIKNDNISAGFPIANTQVYILDKNNRLLPINTIGELCIGGDGVTLGYHNNMELTNKVYINYSTLGRIYKTGDLAFINNEGEIFVLGRTDFQVKVNGKRIELLEIENQVLNVKGIENSIVTVKDNKIICYYLSNKNMDLSIKDYLQKVLPVYMIPNIFIKLESVPLTLNGKIDRKKLFNIDLEEKKDEIILPVNPTQKLIYVSLKNILPDKNFGINNNFFELGLDSFDAIKLKIDLIKKGIKVEYKDIFSHQTIEKLAKYIEKNNYEEEFKVESIEDDFREILDLNKLKIKKDKKESIGDVLLTGVTGFLGAHILDSYMKNEKGNVYCLIRNKNGVSPDNRLREILKYFFNDKYDSLIGKRIFSICGDITKVDFGFLEDEYNNIIQEVDTVIHSAACVKHYGEKKYFFDININGTENIANFCLINNKKLVHISTLSVSGNSFETVNIKKNKRSSQIIYDETSFFTNQNLDNVYSYTKFRAEEIVLKLIKKGLNAKIIRFGNLTGRISDLKFQPNVEDNGFASRLKSVIYLGCIPKSLKDLYVEFTPIDSSAQFTIKVAQHMKNSKSILHAFDHHHVPIKRFIKILNKMGIKIKIVEDSEFSKKISDILSTNESSILFGIINDLDEKNILDYTTNVVIKSDYSIKFMKNIGFKWPCIKDDYVKKYIKYLIDIGFIEL